MQTFKTQTLWFQSTRSYGRHKHYVYSLPPFSCADPIGCCRQCILCYRTNGTWKGGQRVHIKRVDFNHKVWLLKVCIVFHILWPFSARHFVSEQYMRGKMRYMTWDDDKQSHHSIVHGFLIVRQQIFVL